MLAPLLRRSGAFVLVELAAVVVVLLLIGVLLAVGSADVRRQGRAGECVANLKGFGAASAAYGADHGDRVWSFSWRKGVNFIAIHGGGTMPIQSASDKEAAAQEAVDIFRRRAGRYDIEPIQLWLAGLTYSHLILGEYQHRPLPDLEAVCPEDTNRLRWAGDPLAFDRGEFVPHPSDAGNPFGKRWPYSASYQLPPSWYSRDSAAFGAETISQGIAHNFFNVPNAALLGRRLLTDVQYPSQKMMLHDAEARHYGPRVPFFAYAEAKQPLLFADGAVSVRVTEDANPGGRPDSPNNPSPTIFTYAPDAAPLDWETRPLNGLASEPQLRGHYRWTRGGLRGRDYGEAEVAY